MRPYLTLQRKRDGLELAADEVAAFLRAYQDGHVADYHVAAFLMAVFFSGMTRAELDALVDVMLESGRVADLDSVPGIKVDKHSTGGVGDKVSLVLAPLVASLGVPVPMMSGRALGHSGGTVDKLESIPGFRTDLTLAGFRQQLERIGCALIAQTDEIAPLDRRLYALRDATATIESIPLIAASIMSKKLAEGIDALVLDVKVGNGAFIPEPDRAELLARTMIGIGATRGRRVVARLTAMDRPLGVAVGNALEVAEAIDALKGGGPADLREVTLALASEMLVLGGIANDLESAATLAASALDDGRALDRFGLIIEAQGGDSRVVEDPGLLGHARVSYDVPARRSGIVTALDVRAIGLAASALGAGRGRLDSMIDPTVGVHVLVRPGDRVETSQPLATVFARDNADRAAAAETLVAAITLGEEPVATLPLLGRRITDGPV